MSQVAEAFSRVAEEYDRWYEGNPLFLSEVAAVKALGPVPHPSLEIGAGTGRFATSLGIDFGLDPSLAMLVLARRRGLPVICGLAEALPLASNILKGLYFLFSFCFLEDQKKALEEAYRVLKPGGLLVLGIINRDSPLGKSYLEKARRGHPLYRLARFFSPQEVKEMAEAAGFELKKAVSTLFKPPAAPPQEEVPKEGLWPEAGFVVLSFKKS